jgi:hypothetical protein
VRPDLVVQMAVDGVVCEGPCPALLRVTPLQSYELSLRGLRFPQGLQGHFGLGRSEVPAAEPAVRMQLRIADWTVGGEAVTMENFQADRLGQLDIDVTYWGQWEIT